LTISFFIGLVFAMIACFGSSLLSTAVLHFCAHTATILLLSGLFGTLLKISVEIE
jgi:hypothetical protein